MKQEIKLPQTGLVLEGGGMRGTFTAGVLDMFLENNISFPYVIGVSAGACNALSYISGQKGRTRTINIDMLKKYRYIGFKQYLKHGSWIDLNLLFNIFPYKEVPYDFDAAFSNPAIFEMVTTNCITGKAEYLSESTDKDRLIAICKASSSLPFISKPVLVDQTPMLDGGLSNSIPLDRAISQGYTSNVVVLTREKGYRKEVKNIHFPGFIYKDYPAIKRCLNERAEQYNRTLDLIERLEDEKKIIVIRPFTDLKIGRTEKDENKLKALYNHGLEAARIFCNSYKIV
ncbi:MAG: patatin-like phospholipase family protein [Bacteroidales bacterium]